jgi:glycosyl transferase family 87
MDRLRPREIVRALAALRTRARFALVVVLSDLAIYDLLQLVVGLRRHPFPDFLLYWSAARVVITNGPGAIYSAPAFNAVVRAEWGSGPPWPYLNPPVLAWILTPFALLPFSIAFGVWLVASTVALAASARLCGTGWLGVLSAFAFLPVFVALGTGQVAPLVLLALVVMVRLERSGRWAEAGALLAILTVKPQLGLLVPVALLAAGRWRPVAVAAGLGIAVGLATFLTFGLAGTGAWLSAVRSFSDNPYFLRWSFVPLVGQAGWWVGLVVTAILVGVGARRWRGNTLVVVGLGVAGSLLVNHYLTPPDFVMLLLPAWALLLVGGRAAILGAVIWAGGWLAIWFPVSVVAAEGAVIIALALPIPLDRTGRLGATAPAADRSDSDARSKRVARRVALEPPS